MAETLVHMDAFSDYANLTDAVNGGWSNTGSSTFQSGIGPFGENALRCQGGSAFFGRTVPGTAGRNIHVLFYWKTSGATTAGSMLQLKEGATIHGLMQYNGNGTFTISRNGTTVGTTPTSPNLGIVTGTWYHFEVIYDCHDTTGGFDVYVDGIQRMTSGAYNVDTRNAGTAGTIDTVVHTANASSTTHDYTNIAYYTGTSPSQKGIARVVTQFPTGDGGDTQWTASAGSRVSCVDETSSNGDTDYISDSTVGHRNTFTYPGVGLTGTVLGVMPISVARKDDAGTRTIREVIRISSTDYDGAVDKTMTTSYTDVSEIWETDPSGGSWTVAGVDAAESGVKVTA